MKINEIIAMTNKEFSVTIKKFNIACEKAKIKPTKRQAAKWRKKKGVAYKTINA